MTLRYPPRVALVDLARAAAGLLVTAGPLLALPLAWPAELALGAAALVFALFAVNGVAAARLRIELDEDGLCVLPGRRRLAWADVARVSLAYYSLRRDGENGWFELRLRGPGLRLRVDSRLDGFTGLVRASLAAAGRRGLELDPATTDNAAALGAGGDGGAALG